MDIYFFYHKIASVFVWIQIKFYLFTNEIINVSNIYNELLIYYKFSFGHFIIVGFVYSSWYIVSFLFTEMNENKFRF